MLVSGIATRIVTTRTRTGANGASGASGAASDTTSTATNE